jgi:ribosome biogenesis GTPase
LGDGEEIASLYRKAGFSCFMVSAKHPSTILPLREKLNGKVSAFTGNSGVGKSSILNVLQPSLALETGEISQKLGRGRHTTRSAKLFHVDTGFVVDTPGFSSLDVHMVEETLNKEDLFFCFREMEQYFGKCRFSSCVHLKEPGCAVREAVEQGEIASSRYESYTAMYEQLKDKKEWENK